MSYTIVDPATIPAGPGPHPAASPFEDVYAITSGTGWVIVGDTRVPVRRGHYVAVTQDAARHVQGGPEGLTFTAICAPLPPDR
jgi:mannose-6-phosphate isomerase-like protein (cupin superfamily)